MNRYLAEFIGTLLLVFCGVGSAIFDGKSVGALGISLTFGLVLVALIFAIGAVSGCHINPAVTLGVAIAGRMKGSDVVPYWIAQVLGGISGFGFLALIMLGSPTPDMVHTSALATSNGFGDHSPGGYGMAASFVAEMLLTLVLVITVLGATAPVPASGLAGLPIGFALAAINIVGIPITNGSFNPARSIGPAIYAGDWALAQLWLFIVAPLVGGVLAAFVYKIVEKR
jgi:aquaporin Z